MAELEFDNEEDAEDMEPSGLIGEKVVSSNRAKRYDYRHLSPFAVLGFLTFAFFVAVIVMQVLEIKFFEDGNMWPPK